MFLWLILAALLLLLYFKLYHINQYWKDRNVLYIKPWPLIGNTLSFITGRIDFNRWTQMIYNTYDARYFGIYTFMQPSIVIKDFDLIKQVLIKDFNYFVDHHLFSNDFEERILASSLIALTGQEWRDMRAVLSPAFTGSKMRTMFMLMSQCADRFVDHFVDISKQSTPVPLEMKNACTKFTIDVMASCVFGVECNTAKDDQNEFYKHIKAVTNFTGDGIRSLKFLGLVLCPGLMKLLKVRMFSDEEIGYFHNIVIGTIKFREENNIIRPDMIHLLMEARKGRLIYDELNPRDNDEEVESANIIKQNRNNVPELTDDVIIAQVLLFCMAGIDTNAFLASYMSYELAVNQDIQHKLQQEIDEAFECCNNKITYEKLMKMKYLDMVMSETLRKWAPVTLMDRLCVKPYTIKPVGNEQPLELKKGDVVNILAYAMHRDPKYYPDPERFDPERFSNDNKKLMETLPYLPFGLGPRSCIGNRFALLTIKTFFVHLLRKFNIVVIEKSKVPLQLSKFTITPLAKGGLWFGYKLRTE